MLVLMLVNLSLVLVPSELGKDLQSGAVDA